MGMGIGPLIGLFLQSFLLNITIVGAEHYYFYNRIWPDDRNIFGCESRADSILYLWKPGNRARWVRNYLRSLLALGFQGFLILVCVGIYAVLIQGISFSGDVIASIWGVVGYTVLLCFTLFKTGSLAKGVFSAH